MNKPNDVDRDYDPKEHTAMDNADRYIREFGILEKVDMNLYQASKDMTTKKRESMDRDTWQIVLLLAFCVVTCFCFSVLGEARTKRIEAMHEKLLRSNMDIQTDLISIRIRLGME